MKTIFLILLSICVFLSSCQKENNKDCHQNVEIVEIYEDFSCFGSDEDQFRVTQKTALETIFTNCDYESNYDVDFSTHDIIGYKVHGSGCSRTFDARLTKCNATKSYTYFITINQYGLCLPLQIKHMFSEVPKLEEDYQIFFYHEVIENP